MRRFYVISPEMSVVIPICDDGTGPMEYGCDVVEVEARTKRDARHLGFKLMREAKMAWATEHEDGCPFAGMKVEEIHPTYE